MSELLQPHIIELIDIAVQLHVDAGGSQPDKLRALLVGSHEIAHLDGQIQGVQRIGAGLKVQDLMQKLRA